MSANAPKYRAHVAVAVALAVSSIIMARVEPNAGLDWQVLLLVTQEDDGSVWTVYSDFGWIARRHGIKNRDAQFKMASQVIASITSSVASRK